MPESGEYQGVVPADLEDLQNVDHNTATRVGDSLSVHSVDSTGRVHWRSGQTAVASSAVFNVADYGAIGTNGSVDDYAAIQAAITAAESVGVGTVVCSGNVYGLSQDLIINSSLIRIQGAGTLSGIYQGSPTTGTIFKRIGATAGDVIRFQTTAGSATAISGCELQNITIDGNNVADRGLVLKSVQWSTFRNLHIRNCAVVAIDGLIESNVTDGVQDTQGNLFERISIRQVESASGIGIRFDGTAPDGNSSFNDFYRVSVLHKNGVGIKLLNADSNHFVDTLVNRVSAGTAIGVELNGSMSAGVGHARSNSFYGLDPGAGGVTARATGLTQKSVNNHIFDHSRENSAPDPTVEAGASLTLDGIFTGTGIPETLLTAQVGSIYRRLDGGSSATLHVKESGTGSTGWIAVNTRTFQSLTASAGLTAAITAISASGGVRTMTLPTASGIGGKTLEVIKSDSSGNTVTVATTNSETINGASTYSLTTQYQFVKVVSDGTNWLIVS